MSPHIFGGIMSKKIEDFLEDITLKQIELEIDMLSKIEADPDGADFGAVSKLISDKLEAANSKLAEFKKGLIKDKEVVVVNPEVT